MMNDFEIRKRKGLRSRRSLLMTMFDLKGDTEKWDDRRAYKREFQQICHSFLMRPLVFNSFYFDKQLARKKISTGNETHGHK